MSERDLCEWRQCREPVWALGERYCDEHWDGIDTTGPDWFTADELEARVASRSAVAHDAQQPEPCNFCAPLTDDPSPPVRVPFLVALMAIVVAFLLALALATGCAPVQRPPRQPVIPLRHWAYDHALVTVDDAAPPCAVWAAHEAFDVLRPRLDVTIARGPVHEPLAGEIVVEWKRPVGALGLTWTWGNWRSISRALVQVDACATRLFSHEIGHALGLENTEIAGMLMVREYPRGGFVLSERERAALRRE